MRLWFVGDAWCGCWLFWDFSGVGCWVGLSFGLIASVLGGLRVVCNF